MQSKQDNTMSPSFAPISAAKGSVRLYLLSFTAEIQLLILIELGEREYSPQSPVTLRIYPWARAALGGWPGVLTTNSSS